jgi:hypothetical protein
MFSKKKSAGVIIAGALAFSAGSAFAQAARSDKCLEGFSSYAVKVSDYLRKNSEQVLRDGDKFNVAPLRFKQKILKRHISRLEDTCKEGIKSPYLLKVCFNNIDGVYKLFNEYGKRSLGHDEWHPVSQSYNYYLSLDSNQRRLECE